MIIISVCTYHPIYRITNSPALPTTSIILKKKKTQKFPSALVTISLLALLCAIRRRRIRRAKMAKINDAIQQLQSQQAASGAEAGHGTPYSSGAAGGGPPPSSPQYPPPVHNGVNSELNSPHMAHNGDPTSVRRAFYPFIVPTQSFLADAPMVMPSTLFLSLCHSLPSCRRRTMHRPPVRPRSHRPSEML